MLVRKNGHRVGDIFLYVGDMQSITYIGHQHHNTPECDLGGLYLMLVSNKTHHQHPKLVTNTFSSPKKRKNRIQNPSMFMVYVADEHIH